MPMPPPEDARVPLRRGRGGVAGAAFSMIHARLVEERPELLMDLVNPLVATVVLPYRGHEASARELERAAPELPVLPEGRVPSTVLGEEFLRSGRSERAERSGGALSSGGVDGRRVRLPVPEAGSKRGGRYLALDIAPSSGSRLRMTYRTALVLEAIAGAPGISNLGVARHAGVNDQGQVSKLLARLERGGLVQNMGRAQTQGAPNEWRLTTAGEQLQQQIHEHQRQAA
jgi:DNA-binding MarR family transcriptional regulator